MKKLRKVLTSILAVALCFGMLTGIAMVATAADASFVGETKAIEIALADANVNKADAKYVTCVFEYDDGVAVYDVEFHHSATEYNYEIDAKSGKIIEKEKEFYGTAVPPQGGVYIGKADAKEIAFNDAGVKESEAKRVKVSFEYDDGIAEYSVEFHANSNEYEYEIDALTGKILSVDVEKSFSFSDVFFVKWFSSFLALISRIFK